MWDRENSYAQCTPFLTPEHKNTASEFPTRRLVLLRKVCVCGVERRASVTILNSLEWALFMLVMSLRCQAFRKTSYDQIYSKIRHANTFFVQFFVKKIVSQRLSANTTRGSIANITSYWYRVEENFMGFPTKKTACKSEQNSLQAWPMFTCTKTQKIVIRKGGESWCLLSRPHIYFSALSLLHGEGS